MYYIYPVTKASELFFLLKGWVAPKSASQAERVTVPGSYGSGARQVLSFLVISSLSSPRPMKTILLSRSLPSFAHSVGLGSQLICSCTPCTAVKNAKNKTAGRNDRCFSTPRVSAQDGSERGGGETIANTLAYGVGTRPPFAARQPHQAACTSANLQLQPHQAAARLPTVSCKYRNTATLSSPARPENERSKARSTAC